MDINQFLNLIFGTGFIIAIVDRVVGRRRLKEEIAKLTAETKKTNTETDGKHLEQLKISAETMQQLVVNAEELSGRLTKVSSERNALSDEKMMLMNTINGQTFVMQDHNDDRKQWLETIARVLEANAEYKVRISEMESVQKEHTRKIQECVEREQTVELMKQQFFKTIENMGGRLNVFVGILQKNNLEIPEALIWSPEQLKKELNFDHISAS